MDMTDIALEPAALAPQIALLTFWGMRLLSAILILIAGWVIGQWLSRSIKRIHKLDDTLKSFLGGLVKYAVFTIAIVTVLGQFGVQTASLIAVLGAASLAIGLALQGTLTNVASGVMLLILRPFNVGDFIEAGGVAGSVKTLGLFGTELSTPDNVFIFAPNSHIWNSEIKNYSRNTQRRQDIIVGISYKDDIDKAFGVIQKTLAADERIITKTKGKEPEVMVNAMAASSVDITVRIWSKSSDYWALRFDLNKALKEALDENGLTIPFPTQTVEMVQIMQDEEPQKKSAA